MTVVLIRKSDYVCGFKGETYTISNVSKIEKQGNNSVRIVVTENICHLANLENYQIEIL